MDLNNIDLLSLQSGYMKQDPFTRALCAALTPHLQQIATEARNCLLYARIDELPDILLDELAWEMDIDWYSTTAPIEIKRQLIKTAPDIQAHLGTVYAVEEVVRIYFGEGYVQEWWEYGGEPYTFRVITSNPAVTGVQAAEFIRVLSSVKNARSHLDEILINISGQSNIYISGIVHTGDLIELRQVV